MKYPRNEPCPCGSGKKYKACCLPKGIEFRIDGQEVVRVHRLDPEMVSLLRKQRDMFIAAFGREPNDDDPVFFNVTEEDVTQKTVAILKEIGTDPAIIHAYKKTGMLVTEHNIKQMTDSDLREWRDALAEYETLH